MSDVTEIHLVSNETGDSEQPLNLRDVTPTHFVSGFWKIKEEHLSRGVIFALHKTKKDDSFIQGAIEDVEMVRRKLGQRVEVRVRRTSKPLPWVGSGSGEKGYKYRAHATTDSRQKIFVPPNISEEELRKVSRDCVLREGQQDFRNELLRAYRRKCAATSCEIEFLLEAAHILPYKDHGKSSSHVQNGLLLRADIHVLFDRRLIAFRPVVDGEGVWIEIADRLKGSEYEDLDGQKLRIPSDDADRPSRAALNIRMQRMPVL